MIVIWCRTLQNSVGPLEGHTLKLQRTRSAKMPGCISGDHAGSIKSGGSTGQQTTTGEQS
jgi:hypothetical protein